MNDGKKRKITAWEYQYDNGEVALLYHDAGIWRGKKINTVQSEYYQNPHKAIARIRELEAKIPGKDNFTFRKRNFEAGIEYLSDRCDTMLIPNLKGHIILRGIEDDTYTLTEVATDKGYVLLRDPVKIMVITKEDGACERCGAALLTASATVNGEPVSMTDANAVVPLRIINNPGFDLPKTGGYGVWMYTVGGVLLLGAAAFIVVKSRKHKSEQ